MTMHWISERPPMTESASSSMGLPLPPPVPRPSEQCPEPPLSPPTDFALELANKTDDTSYSIAPFTDHMLNPVQQTNHSLATLNKTITESVAALETKQTELTLRMKLRKQMHNDQDDMTVDAALAAQREFRKRHDTTCKALKQAREELTVTIATFKSKAKRHVHIFGCVLKSAVENAQHAALVIAFQSWANMAESSKRTWQTRAAQAETVLQENFFREQLLSCCDRKSREARRVLERVCSARDTDLACMALGAWRHCRQDSKQLQEMAKVRKESLFNQTVKLHVFLERTNVAITLKVWRSHCCESKNQRVLTNQVHGAARAQRERLRAVLGRVLRYQAAEDVKLMMQTWAFTAKEGKWIRADRQTQSDMGCLQQKLDTICRKTKSGLQQNLNRILDTAAAGLTMSVFAGWRTSSEDHWARRKEEATMRERMACRKKVWETCLEKHTCTSNLGALSNHFHHWKLLSIEPRVSRNLQFQHDEALQIYKNMKNGETMQVVKRMSRREGVASLQQIIVVWWMLAGFKEFERRMRRRLEVSRSVVERLVVESEAAWLRLVVHAWMMLQESGHHIKEVSRRMQALIGGQRREAQRILEKNIHLGNVSLLLFAFGEWVRVLEQGEHAVKMARLERCQISSQKLLTGILARTLLGCLNTVTQSWRSYLLQQKALRELRVEVDSRLKEHLDRKRTLSMSVAQRMYDNTSNALKLQVLSLWRLTLDINALRVHVQKQRRRSMAVCERVLQGMESKLSLACWQGWVESSRADIAFRSAETEAKQALIACRSWNRETSTCIVHRNYVRSQRVLVRQAFLVWVCNFEFDRVRVISRTLAEKNKKNLHEVLGHSMRTQEKDRSRLCWQGWRAAVQLSSVIQSNERAWHEGQRELLTLRGQLSGLQKQRSNDVATVLGRMQASCDTGYLLQVFCGWLGLWERRMYLRAGLQELRDLLGKRRSRSETFSVKHSLSRDPGSKHGLRVLCSILAQDSEWSEASGMVDWIFGESDHALLQQVMMVWIMAVAELHRQEALQEELKQIITLHGKMEVSLRETESAFAATYSRQ